MSEGFPKLIACTNGRVIRPERLEFAEPAVAEPGLRDLVRINRWLGGHRVLAGLFGRLARPDEQFSVLDVGAASGDMGDALRRRFPHAGVVSLDRRPFHLRHARPPRVAADAFQPPFRAESFDFVICSLFLHHFPNEQIVELIASFRRMARRAVVVLDLERHPFAYNFLPASRWLFGWRDITVHDGRISVEAGFRPEEMAMLARAAGASDFTVRRHRPWFRLSLVIHTPDHRPSLTLPPLRVI